MDHLFRWIEQFDAHLDWQRDDPFFELESVTDWTGASVLDGERDEVWGVGGLAA